MPYDNTDSASSLAVAQRAIHDHAHRFSLYPPLTEGDPLVHDPRLGWPLEIEYDLGRLGPEAVASLFAESTVGPGLGRWAPLLPPLVAGLDPGIGGTRLVDVSASAPPGPDGVGRRVLVKDESANPTWSHKDRLNLTAVSAAAHAGAPGVVVASSGNHGASAAALAARAGLPAVVVMSVDSPPAAVRFAAAYGATVLLTGRDERWSVLAALVDEAGLHPVSNRTATHTGHPFGPEGYTTIAYELYLQLGRALPAAVFVPTGYGELLYGVWKGFGILRALGVTGRVPAIYPAEVGGRGTLRRALEAGVPALEVEPSLTEAYSLATTVGGYRATHVAHRSAGRVIGLDDAQLRAAQRVLAGQGLWQELSGAAGFAAALRAIADGDEALADGPLVAIATSNGLKDLGETAGGAVTRLSSPGAAAEAVAIVTTRGARGSVD